MNSHILPSIISVYHAIFLDRANIETDRRIKVSIHRCCSLPRRYMLYKVRTIGSTSPVHASPVCTWALGTILDWQSPCTQNHNRQLAHALSKIYWSTAVPPGTGRPLPLSPLTLVRPMGTPTLYTQIPSFSLGKWTPWHNFWSLVIPESF